MNSILLAEVMRDGHVESRHCGSYVVTDTQGKMVLSGGDAGQAIYPRSAVKALQALPLVVSGTAQRLDMQADELALACASHVGTTLHAEAAARMLARAGRDESCLECGTQWPSSGAAARALASSGRQAGPLHNNCSGKHAGFVCTAVASGREPAGYVAPDHPVMREVTAAIDAVLDAGLSYQVPAVDGCSIPTYRVPLDRLAAGFARFGSGVRLPEGFAQAAAVLRRAVADNPVMLSGTGRFDTVVAEALGEAAFVKVGAEGVYCGALPGLGLGFALKCDDGAARAAEVATAALLRRLLGPHDVLDRLAAPVLHNWRGIAVGAVVGHVD